MSEAQSTPSEPDEWVYTEEPVGPNCPFGHPWNITERIRSLHNEVDCRIEHGAESGGHLEYVRAQLGEMLSGL